MKIFVLSIIIFSLYLIYRLSFPKQPEAKPENPRPSKPEIDADGAVEKKRYVLPAKGHREPIAAMPLKAENQPEKASTFAPENEKSSAIVSAEMQNDVFDNEPDPEDLDIEPDADETNDIDSEDIPCEDASPAANGISIEEMTVAVKAIGNPADDNADVLCKVETTDMFEQLVSSDEGKRQRIAAVIDRYVQRQNPEVESEDDGEWQAFDIAKYVSKTV